LDLIMEQQNIPQPPPQAQGSAQGTYLWYVSNGFPPQMAYDLTVEKFGPPKSAEEQAREAAKAAEKFGYAKIGGQLLGTAGGIYAAGKLASVGGAAGAGAGAGAVGTGAVAQPALLGGAKILGGSGAAVGGGTAAGGAAGASTLGAIGSVALPVAAAALAINNAWETGMKDIVRGKGNREDWINQGFNLTFGGLPNIAARMIGGRSIGAMMTSGKSMPQKIRDDFRGHLKEAGVADDDYMVTLADGTKFNIGLDGKTKYQNVGENIDGKSERNAWDVDFTNPLAEFAVEKLDPMIKGIYGGDNPDAKVFPSQFTGMLVNAATSNAQSEEDVIANIESMLGESKFAKGLGLTPPKPAAPAKAEKGEVARVSPGMYVDDKGKVRPANTMRAALEKAYKGKQTKKNQEL